MIRSSRRAGDCLRRAARFAAAVAVVASAQATVAAQPAATAAGLKAAFLYNFAKFAEWPGDALAPGQRLSMCVVGDDALADALEDLIRRRAVDGHQLTVQMVKTGSSLRGCHVLYVSGEEFRRFPRVLDAIAGAAVFSVSDGGAFAESGGVAQLILERDRMRFAINVKAAQRARLHISANLLSLATIVKDHRDGT
jgi:hypothetical protein